MRPPANLALSAARDRAASRRAFSRFTRHAGPLVPSFTAAATLRRQEAKAARKRAEVADLVAEVRADGRVQNALLFQKRTAEHAAKFGTLPARTARRLPTPPREPFIVRPTAPVVGVPPRRK